MRSFFQRLDLYVEKMIDTDGMLSAKRRLQPIPIKALFDNLRYYMVLAFMWVGVKLLRAQDDALAVVTAILLAAVTSALGCLVALQSSFIFLATVFTLIGSLMPRRKAVRLRRNIRANAGPMKILVLVFAVVVAATMVFSVTVLLATLGKNGLL